MQELQPTSLTTIQTKEILSGTIASRFLIGERLGKGGMGEVYRAEDTKLKRIVALKRLAPHLRADPLYRRRFQEEAQRVSRFSDPHIASVYDVLEDRGEMFLVMEYVEGRTLRERLRHAITLDEFMDIAIQCAQALIAAHERGIVHCDIKPENIMLTSSGQVKILDFGIGKHLPRSDQSSTIDRSGSLSGTPAYMAPEVLLEKSPDGRADIFSLGIVFYETLTGHHPFLADTFVGTIDRIRHETPAPMRIFNSKVPQQLETVVGKAVAKEPTQRYARARDLLEALNEVRTATTPGGLLRVLPPHPERSPRQTVLKVTAALIFAAALLLLVFMRGEVKRWFGTGKTASVHLAVLPFTSTSNDSSTKAFCDGLTETLAAKLTQLTGSYPLQVVPTSEVRAEGVTSAEQARRDFGVNLVLEGSLHGSGEQARLTYSLVDAKTRLQLSAGTVDANVADALAVEDRVVAGVVGMLGLQVQSNDRVVLAAHGTSDASAYEQYLRGRGYLLEYHKPENIDNAVASFNRALTLDPKYAQAYAALGEAYWHGYHEVQRGSEWMEKARSACEHAVATAPNVADGYSCLGRVYRGIGEYEKAVAQFQKATTLDSTSDDAFRGLADAYQKLNRPAEAEATYRQAIRLRPQYWAGYSWLGFFYSQQGQYDDAIKMFQEVVNLAPDNFRGYSNLGAMYVVRGRYREAIVVLERSVSIRPTNAAYDNLGGAYFSMRRFDQAARNFEQSVNLNRTSWLGWGNLGDAYYWAPGRRQDASNAYREAIRLSDEKLRVNPRDGSTLAYRATYLAMLDEKDKALDSLQQAASSSPKDPDVRFRGALVFNHFRDIEHTLQWLQEALAFGVPASLVRDTPDFDYLHSDPRFQAILRRH